MSLSSCTNKQTFNFVVSLKLAKITLFAKGYVGLPNVAVGSTLTNVLVLFSHNSGA